MSNHGKRWQREGKRRANRLCPRLEMLEHRVVLSTFTVNTTLDTVAANLKAGKDASGHVSLRSAIMAADAKGGSNKIVLPAGTFTLTIAPTGNDDASSGDLDITGNLTITGKGESKTIIDGNNVDRVFDIESGKASITGMTVQHGRVTGDGGGILNSGGNVTLTSVSVSNNAALGFAGTQGASGTALSINGVRGSAGGNAEGGGIFNAGGSLSLSKCLVSLNQVTGGEGGAGGTGAEVTGANGASATGGNGGAGGGGGGAFGGGIFNGSAGSLTISGTTFSSNQAIGGNGGLGGIGGAGIGSPGGAAQAVGRGKAAVGAPVARRAKVRALDCSIAAGSP